MLSKEIDPRPPAIKERLELDRILIQLIEGMEFGKGKRRVFYSPSPEEGMIIQLDPSNQNIMTLTMIRGQEDLTESRINIDCCPSPIGAPDVRSVDDQGEPDPYANHLERVRKALEIINKGTSIDKSFFTSMDPEAAVELFERIKTKQPVFARLLVEDLIDALDQDRPQAITKDPRFKLIAREYPDTWPTRFPILLDLLDSDPEGLGAMVANLRVRKEKVTNILEERDRAINERIEIGQGFSYTLIAVEVWGIAVLEYLSILNEKAIAFLTSERARSLNNDAIMITAAVVLENCLVAGIDTITRERKLIKQLGKIDKSLKILEERKGHENIMAIGS